MFLDSVLFLKSKTSRKVEKGSLQVLLTLKGCWNSVTDRKIAC